MKFLQFGRLLNKLIHPKLAWPQTIRPNWHSNKGFTSEIVKLSNHNTNFVRDLVGLIVISDPCFSLGKCKHRVYFQFYQVLRPSINYVDNNLRINLLVSPFPFVDNFTT